MPWAPFVTQSLVARGKIIGSTFLVELNKIDGIEINIIRTIAQKINVQLIFRLVETQTLQYNLINLFV